jgi:hypothetical protein
VTCGSLGRWFSPGTRVSSTSKTDYHNITEILLKVAFTTVTPKPTLMCYNYNLCKTEYNNFSLSRHWPHFHGLLALLYWCQDFMIRLLSPLPYNPGSPCLVHTSWCVHSVRHVSPDLGLIFMVCWLLCLYQVFMIRSLSPLPYKLGPQSLIHTFIMLSACEPGMCHLTLTSFSWCTDFVKFMSSFHD